MDDAAKALSALARALHKEQAFALVRCVLRKGGTLQWGVLSPYLVNASCPSVRGFVPDLTASVARLRKAVCW